MGDPITHGGAVGCAELGESGSIDTGMCCERCHAADGLALGGIASLGPCREVLPDGRLALVCCSARRQLS